MKILFATDGRPPAVAAGELLRRLVDPSKAEVTILHALEYGNEVVADSYATGVLGEAEQAFRSVGIESTAIRVDGDPAECIEKELSDEGYGLTVVGAGNHTWLGRLVFGSVSTHLLHVAPSPILLVHRAPPTDHDRLRVVIGADGSPASMRAIDTLVALTAPDRVEVSVRAVVRTPDLAFAAYPGGVVPAAFVEEALGSAKHAATDGLERALERLRAAGFAPHGSLGSRWPATDLLDRVERDEADLLVVGARGVGRIERLAMGSVSAHVARHAPATLVAHADLAPDLGDDIEDPDGDVSHSRYAVRWR